MAGRPRNQERGPQGGTVSLDVIFRKYQGGPVADDDRWLSESKMPVVTIRDPNGEVVERSTDTGNVSLTRTSPGAYLYVFQSDDDAEISADWQITWEIRINDEDVVVYELFSIFDPEAPAEFASAEHRIGFGFNNPDLTSDHHAPGWGLLVSPDDLRYISLFGAKLTSPDANQVYDNNMLQYYIDAAIGLWEREYNWDLYPRLNLFIPGDTNGTQLNSRPDRTAGAVPMPETYKAFFDLMTAAQKFELVRYEQGYPYRRNTAHNNYMLVKTMARPVLDMETIKMVDPLHSELLDLKKFARVSFREGEVRFAVSMIAQVIPLPIFMSGVPPYHYPFPDFPHAYIFDYRSGYVNAAQVPKDLREVIRWIASILLMHDLGPGKSPGLASASSSLNSISDSFSTTQSAENALYGADMIMFQKLLKEWHENNKYKYGVELLGAL